ncbi:hypothetical protein E4S40_11865 [Algoriphagus kandeliae]|uniref:ATP-grasp domain-containing protein n=1 Tax=Algoriphagus kandeliae TaxID=2562278 RepID=A0A4Y9QS64_9BACT|nr:sugar-transfer associated ATP-grasp domain-containing protein [Algoriphagus kandeliae]TFV94698.1 hypothetical protein E4S40_11865 [Algoriphagus kandeliae]
MNLDRIKNLFVREAKKLSPYHQWYSKDPNLGFSPQIRRLLIKNGFLPSDYLIFNFKEYSKELYLNERDYKKIKSPNGSFAPLINNKAFLPIILSNRPDLLPELFAFSESGTIRFEQGLGSTFKSTIDYVGKALEKFGEIIVKPCFASGGHGIFKINKENFLSLIKQLEKGEYVLNNFLENDPFFQQYFPYTLNTTRVIFFRNSLNENEILMVGQRFGNSLSEGVDNASKGGMACGINLTSGTMTKAYSYINPTYRGWFSKHMETNIQIEGIRIPNWDEKFTEISRLVIKDLDFLKFGGIDLAFTPNGIKIIEINSMPGPQLMQVEKPALINKEFEKFLLSFGFTPKFTEHKIPT